jgi:hypothetical protein
MSSTLILRARYTALHLVLMIIMIILIMKNMDAIRKELNSCRFTNINARNVEPSRNFSPGWEETSPYLVKNAEATSWRKSFLLQLYLVKLPVELQEKPVVEEKNAVQHPPVRPEEPAGRMRGKI